MTVWACSVTKIGPIGRQASQGPPAGTQGGNLRSLNEEKCFLCSILGTPLMWKYLRTKKEADILRVLARLSWINVLPLNLSWEQVKGTNLSNIPTWAITVTGRKGAWKSADVIILMYNDTSVWPSTVASKLVFHFICVYARVKQISNLQKLSHLCSTGTLPRTWQVIEKRIQHTFPPAPPQPESLGCTHFSFVHLLKLQAVLASLGKEASALIL